MHFKLSKTIPWGFREKLKRFYFERGFDLVPSMRNCRNSSAFVTASINKLLPVSQVPRMPGKFLPPPPIVFKDGKIDTNPRLAIVQLICGSPWPGYLLALDSEWQREYHHRVCCFFCGGRMHADAIAFFEIKQNWAECRDDRAAKCYFLLIRRQSMYKVHVVYFLPRRVLTFVHCASENQFAKSR